MLKDREEMLYRAPLAILGVFIFIMGILAWPGLTSSLGFPGQNAGQGVEVVEGFAVSNISYDAIPAASDPEATILTVSFDIVRTGTNAGIPVDYRNAGTFVQLRSGSTRSEWQKCTLDQGYATCNLEDVSQMNADDITNLSVVAFDSQADNIPFVATGGTIYETTINGIDYRVHEFTSVGTTTFDVVSIPLVARVEFFIVGGGGGGAGGFAGGGGGGGGVIQGTTGVTAMSYSITVGAGGAARSGVLNSQSGGASTAFSRTALGGGGGGGRDNWSGLSGASGGGGGWQNGGPGGTTSGGAGTTGQGFAGGSGFSGGGASMGGGGGGFLSAGENRTSNTKAGDGGTGITTTFTGTSRSFAGGGGGGAEPSAAAAGVGKSRGGNGGRNGLAATSAAANSGSGGGGAARQLSSTSGAGGSGIVIIRYRI